MSRFNECFFKVGDLVTGLPDSDRKYSYTTRSMFKGRVTAVSRDHTQITIRILSHKDPYHIGKEYPPVLASYFRLLRCDEEQNEQT